MAIDVYLQINGIKGEVEIRALRKDGLELPVSWQDSEYDGAGTAKLIAIFLGNPAVRKILFNDQQIHGVSPRRHHDNHFHVDLRARAA